VARARTRLEKDREPLMGIPVATSAPGVLAAVSAVQQKVSARFPGCNG
jgi:hypothetical protein